MANASAIALGLQKRQGRIEGKVKSIKWKVERERRKEKGENYSNGSTPRRNLLLVKLINKSELSLI